MSRAVIIELPRASSLRGADCLVPGIRRAGVPKIAPNFATLRDERERERELLETICHWHKFGEKEEGLFVTTLWLHIGAQTCLRLEACVFIVLTIVVLDKLVYVHIYKGCLKEANLLRGISLDLSGKGVDLEDLSFATRVPIHLCGNGRGIRSSLSLSLCLVYCVTDSESDTFTRLEDSFWDLTT